MEGSVSIFNVFNVTGEYQMVFAASTFQVKFDAQMSLAPLGQVDASGILTVTSGGIYGALQLGGKFQLGPLELFGAMQLEINSFNTPVTIERVQYDFDNRRVSNGRVPVVLPANSQRIFIGGIMVIPGFELEGSFEMINNPNVFSVSVKATFNDGSYLWSESKAFRTLPRGPSRQPAASHDVSQPGSIPSSRVASRMAASRGPSRMADAA